MTRARRPRSAAGAPPPGRGRKLRGLILLLSPYRGRVALMFVSLIIATAAALAPPPLAKLAIDKGIVPGDMTALTWIVVAFLVSRARLLGRDLRADLPRGLDRPARAAGPARSSSSSTCRACRVGFYSRRRAGVLISRMSNDVEALDTLVSDGIVTLFGSSLTLIGTAAILFTLDAAARADHLHRLPGARASRRSSFRIVSADAYRATREKVAAITGLPAGDAVGHPRRAHVRAGAAPPAPLRGRSTRRTATRT